MYTVYRMHSEPIVRRSLHDEVASRVRDMIIEDCPAYGSMGRTRYYLVQPWLKNFKPTENFHNWLKYLDVDESKRK